MIVGVILRKPFDKLVFLVELWSPQPILYLRVDWFIVNILRTDFGYGLSIVMELGDYGLLNGALDDIRELLG